ncbi:MAG: galactokinase family protein, partial [Anaerolineae bacterium]
EDLRQWLPAAELAPLLANHSGFSAYPVRGVVLFGLAECERSRIGAELLAQGQLELFGKLMCISHDGDRVTRIAEDGALVDYHSPTGDDYLRDLMNDLDSRDPELMQRARLELQPGAYRCSTADIDRMVDIARDVPGVLGAQLAGAGLGGCMMVLAHSGAIEQLRRELAAGYYHPRGLEPAISVCAPIAGSGILGQNGGMAP